MSRSSHRRRTSLRAPDPRAARQRRRRCRIARGVALALLLCVSALGAQEAQAPEQSAAEALPAAWQGAEGLLVLVTNERGEGIPGVAVVLRRAESREALHGLATDAAGRLEISGLAPGEWQVDLSREGFMLYTAYLKLDPAKDPEVGFSSRQRTGTYWAPLQAVFLRPGDAPVAAQSAELRTGRATAKEARQEAEQLARQERRAQERLERQARKGDTARVIEEPATDEAREPRAKPAAERPSPRQSIEPESPVAVAEAADPPARPAPTSVDPPAPSAPEAVTPSDTEPDADRRPTAPPAPPAPAAPRLLPNPTLRPAGACVECKPGEWSVAISGRAAIAGPCADDGGRLVAAAELVADGLSGELRSFAGPLLAEDENDVLRLLSRDTAAAVRERLGSFASPESSCVVLGLVLPAGARYVGFRYEAGERGTWGECPLGGECQIGEAAWRSPPVITQRSGITVVHAVFENRSARRERLPRLTVYFRPEAGWLPPSGR